MPDMNNHTIEGLRAQRDALLKFAHDIAEGYDHEDDAHKYNNGACRVCNAEALIATIEGLPREAPVTVSFHLSMDDEGELHTESHASNGAVSRDGIMIQEPKHDPPH